MGDFAKCGGFFEKGDFAVFGTKKSVKKWQNSLSRGKDVEFHLFVENLFSTPKMWKMWKSSCFEG